MSKKGITRVTILYKSGQKMTFDCEHFTAEYRTDGSGEIIQASWSVHPAYKGPASARHCLPHIEAIWQEVL